MSEQDRSRDREMDLQKAIHKLQEQIANSQALCKDEDIRMLLGFQAWIMSIISSEYGTIMRMLDRQDRHQKLIEGNGDGENAISLKDVYNTMRGWRRFRWYTGTMITGLVMAKAWELLGHLPK